jgi:4-amino-4-deoxy-L-arabinose transferase-like glycosyltransferase
MLNLNLIQFKEMNKNYSLKYLSFLWLCCFILASIFLSFSHFKSDSNDSKYYTELVVRYKDAPWSQVLTPKWGENYWGFDKTAYMRDQFPGQLIMGVSLTRVGIPSEQALHILGMFFQVGSILLLAAIAQHLLLAEAALFLSLALLLTPLSFSYNIRANHELGIMFFSFLSLYSGFNLTKSKWLAIIVALCSASLLLIKGPFFIFTPVLLSIGYFYSDDNNQKKDLFYFLSTLFLSLCSVLFVTLLFEYLFMKITGESFLREFWRIQIEQRAMSHEQKHFFVIQKLLNFYYYFSHYLVYSLPWTLVLLLYVIIKKKTNEFMSFFISRPSMLFFSSSIIFCFFFSMSDRVAGRYTFPGYFLFSAWSAIALYSLSPLLKNKVSFFKNNFFFIIPIFWFFTFALHFL